MSKPRAAALLGGLTVAGMLVLSSLVGASQGQSYFSQLKGALGRGCLQHATENVGSGQQEIFRAACSFVASTMQELTPDAAAPEKREALLGAFAAETPGLGTPTSCMQCVQTVQDFESYLATNGTAAGIEDALALGCQKKFTSTLLTECLQNLADMSTPQLIDFALANLPPVTACTEMQMCP